MPSSFGKPGMLPDRLIRPLGYEASLSVEPEWKEATMTKLTTEDRDELAKGSFAFPEQRKEPLENASHVRNAISRFNQVKDVTDADRDAAWERIKAAAKRFDVEVSEKSWHEIGK
jgi:ElaB/YqjD/DUF883 family membrane-anchored ribosome-binding protein